MPTGYSTSTTNTTCSIDKSNINLQQKKNTIWGRKLYTQNWAGRSLKELDYCVWLFETFCRGLRDRQTPCIRGSQFLTWITSHFCSKLPESRRLHLLMLSWPLLCECHCQTLGCHCRGWMQAETYYTSPYVLIHILDADSQQQWIFVAPNLSLIYSWFAVILSYVQLICGDIWWFAVLRQAMKIPKRPITPGGTPLSVSIDSDK